MKIRYDDILGIILNQPDWWLDGVPRFRVFDPRDVGVYASEAALIVAECQLCGWQFEAGIYAPSRHGPRLFHSGRISEVGDPPRHASRFGDDCDGATMGSVVNAIREFWSKTAGTYIWQRQRDREREFSDS